MKISKFLFKTQKERTSFDVITDRLIRGNFALQESAGIFQYAPLGTKIMLKLENLIRKYFDPAELQEVRLPMLQDLSLWQESGRENAYGPEMFRLINRDGKRFCLAPTAEECIVFMIKKIVESYTSLPVIAYQMLYKYRDELRPRYGLIRNKEFSMMDAYSFDESLEKTQESYHKMYRLYIDVLRELNVSFVFTAADTGEVGGSFSQNVFVRSEIGEDVIRLTVPWNEYEDLCNKAGNYNEILDLSKYISENGQYEYRVVEIGHIFNLGEKYSESMSAAFTNSKGERQNYVMGCYGIGISRLLQVLLEQHKYLPAVIAPYKYHLVGIDVSKADELYSKLKAIEVIYDDRVASAGQKFNDADLIGIPNRIIAGKNIELINMITGESKLFDSINSLIEYINPSC
jgi:prolyl-tRNA synthetase